MRFDAHLTEHIATGWAAVRPALALVSGRKLPVHVLAEMVQTKALGALLVAPFLFLLVENARDQLLQFQITIAGMLLGSLLHAPKGALLLELGWRDWWTGVIRRSLLKDASLRCGYGAPMTVRLNSGQIDQMAGDQLPIVLHVHADRLDTPTFTKFLEAQDTTTDAYTSYRRVLNTRLQLWWQNESRVLLANIVWPFPYSSIAFIEACPASLLGQLQAPWDIGLKAFSWVRFRAGLVQLGATRANKLTTNALSPCLACGAERSANMSHLVVCPVFVNLNRDIDFAFQQHGKVLPADGWSRAFKILEAECSLSLERIQYCISLEAGLMLLHEQYRGYQTIPHTE